MNLNPEFIKMIDRPGDDRLKGLAETLTNTPATVALRVNPLRFAAMPPTVVASHPVGWNARGVILEGGGERRPQFTWDPLMHAGGYYVQEAGSMIHGYIIERLLGERENREAPVALLDACAAPGGKTTAAIDVLPEGSVVVANEWDFRRAEVLRENLTKWGRGISTIITRGDTRRFRKLGETFDVVIADVPCSGEGMFRKDPVAVEQWSPRLVAECRERQEEIIDNLWGSVKPGGWLIYSTCTFNRTEDEGMVEWIMENYGAEPVEIAVDVAWGITGEMWGGGGNLPVMRFIPGITETEGLFVAVLRKPGEEKGEGRKRERSKGGRKARTVAREVEEWVKGPEGGELSYHLTEGDGGAATEVWAVDERWAPLRDMLLREADVIAPGLHVATLKGKSVIPAHALALSEWMDEGAFPRVDLDYPSAITYLQRGMPELPEDTPRGYVVMTYRGRPLGFVKNLGNRANSLYPQEWRILSTHVPEGEVRVFADEDSSR